MSSNSEKVKKWRANNKKRIIEAFGNCCGICGYNRCPDALEFHHLDPSQKEFTLGSVRATPKNWDSLVIELRKCVMLCSNCHREHHYGIQPDLSNCLRFDETFADYKETNRLAKMHECELCGTLSNNKTYCSVECSSKVREKISWPSIEELTKLIWEKPTTHIAKDLGVSDKAVEKRIKKLGLTKPPRGYWMKK